MAASISSESALGSRLYRGLSRFPMWAFALLWLLPSLGLFLNSFRSRDAPNETLVSGRRGQTI